jgi:hypothetical protein
MSWNFLCRAAFIRQATLGDDNMLRGGLLWLIGIPIPVIIVLWLLGYL